jgi:hypothetical protein
VRLVRCTDPYTRLHPGDEGTIAFVDDWGTLHVSWDSGSRLGLVPGEDAWELLSLGPPSSAPRPSRCSTRGRMPTSTPEPRGTLDRQRIGVITVTVVADDEHGAGIGGDDRRARSPAAPSCGQTARCHAMVKRSFVVA